MLDGYTSEKEQLESIRKWWNEHGKAILIAVVVGLGLGLVWRYWHKLSVQRSENASVVYQQVLEANSKGQTKTVQGGVDFLMSHFASTPYASLGAMLYAKNAVMQNQFPDALTKLQWVIDHGSVKRLKEVARISSARILLSEGKPADALKQIKVVDDNSFMPLVEWVTGDIDTAQGNAAEAKKHYQNAKNELVDFPPASDVLTQLMSN